MLYLDTSALVKMVAPAPESAALLELALRYPERASSALAATELRRAVRRGVPSPSALERAERLLRGLTLIPLDDALLQGAAELELPGLRPSDAIHLASASFLGNSLGAFAVYDLRLAAAALTLGLPVVSPAGASSLPRSSRPEG